MPTPHALIGGLLDSVAGGLNEMGGTISGALDKPFAKLGGPQGPHHIVKRIMDSAVKSLTVFGNDVESGLNHPTEQFGIPPDIAIGALALPKLLKR